VWLKACFIGRCLFTKDTRVLHNAMICVIDLPCPIAVFSLRVEVGSRCTNLRPGSTSTTVVELLTVTWVGKSTRLLRAHKLFYNVKPNYFVCALLVEHHFCDSIPRLCDMNDLIA